MTRVLSVWRPDPGSAEGVAPDESLPRLSAQLAARVADYLDAGAVVARTTARAVDPWSTARVAQVPLSLRTDGVWRWDDAVSYYVRTYGLSPDLEFITYLRERHFAPPAPSREQVSAVADELFGKPADPPDYRLALDGSQLLPCGTYCVYRGQAFRCSQNDQKVRLSVGPGESIPEGFERKGDGRAATPTIAHKVVLAADVDAFYEVITSCRYKGAPFSVRAISGTQLFLSIGGGRREKLVPEPPHPTRNEWGQFPNAKVLGVGEIGADIDLVEAAQITMAIVPYRMSSEHLVPVNDPTGYGYAVPAADEIFYFPAPIDSPFLPGKDALTTISAYLAVHDPAYPVVGLTVERLRDGWRVHAATPVELVYYVADDGHILAAPATASTGQVASRLSEDFRLRHPVVNPPPHHDSGTEIFD